MLWDFFLLLSKFWISPNNEFFSFYSEVSEQWLIFFSFVQNVRIIEIFSLYSEISETFSWIVMRIVFYSFQNFEYSSFFQNKVRFFFNSEKSDVYFVTLRTMRAFFHFSERQRYYFYIIKILHILYIRFVWQIFNFILMFKYVYYTIFFFINHHSIFVDLFQSKPLRQLKASLLIYNSTCWLWKWNHWKKYFILSPVLRLLLVCTILLMMRLY